MKKISTIIILCFVVLTLSAQKATNVVARQVGKNIEVTYDLDKASDVSLSVSTDGGRTYSQPLVHVSGNVGKGVTSGSNKKIIWDVLSEHESLIYGSVVFMVNTLSDQTFTVKGVSFTMVYVQGGTFTMGATLEQDSDVLGDEKPTHSVTLSSFSIGETEVTQALWQAVMGKNVTQIANRNVMSINGVGSNYPMYYISWDDCQTFISKLNNLLLNQLGGKHFRLPTEAEWEYAAKGGNKSRVYKYSGSNNFSDVAWFVGNSNSSSHPVKQKRPNELGLYDMSGNVWEWCSDWYGSYSYSSQINPTGPSSGSYRVLRGGSWFDVISNCHSSFRYYLNSDYKSDYLGLRLVLSE